MCFLLTFLCICPTVFVPRCLGSESSPRDLLPPSLPTSPSSSSPPSVFFCIRLIFLKHSSSSESFSSSVLPTREPQFHSRLFQIPPPPTLRPAMQGNLPIRLYVSSFPFSGSPCFPCPVFCEVGEHGSNQRFSSAARLPGFKSHLTDH